MDVPVCHSCHCAMYCEKTGAYVLGISGNRDAKEPSLDMLLDPKYAWMIRQIWKADLYKCPGCAARVFSSFGVEPIASTTEQMAAEIENILSLVGTQDILISWFQ